MAPFRNDEVLIELVKKNSILYDLSHRRYVDSHLKDKVWKTIAKKLNTDVPTCRSRWHNIRDQYRKTLKRNIARISHNSNSKPIRHYKYSDRLEFLNPFFHEREARQTDNQEGDMATEDEESTLDQETTDILYVETSLSPTLHPGPNFSPVHAPSSSSRPESPAAPASPTFCSVSSPLTAPVDISPRSQRKDPSQTTLASLMKYKLKKEDEPQHPVDVFLDGIAITLKNLSPYYQNFAKSDLFAVAQKYEMQMLMESNQVPKANTQNVSNKRTMKNEDVSPSSSNSK